VVCVLLTLKLVRDSVIGQKRKLDGKKRKEKVGICVLNLRRRRRDPRFLAYAHSRQPIGLPHRIRMLYYISAKESLLEADIAA
jgi:hypothetical protein